MTARVAVCVTIGTPGPAIGGVSAQIVGVSELCADRPAATGAVEIPATRDEAETGARGPSIAGVAEPGPASDLYCIDLIPTGRAETARGVVELGRVPGPFGVSVTADGFQISELTAWLSGLPDPARLGDYTTYVAWATPVSLDRVIRLGEVRNGRNELGRVALNKYLLWISAEVSADGEDREGPLILRGRSPSTLMEAHDLLATAPSATQRSATRRPDRGPGAEPWPHPPAYPGIPMLPGIMDLEPFASPYRSGLPAPASLPLARSRDVVELPNGGTLDLEAGFVRRDIGGRSIAMLAFNGQHPGPLIKVAASSTIFVDFTNRTPFPTAVHWHGVRIDNRFDGVPGVTQEPVAPGETFRYRVHFRDAGIYWYHPHHREDIQQELGLYGNLLVESGDPEYFAPVNREEVLMLDDLLLDADGFVPFGEESSNYMLMGRFGNQPLVNGEPEYALDVDRGEIVRFYLTNASNTRTFNLSFASASGGENARHPIKVVGSDIGKFEREEWAESVVLAPAERYVVEVRFGEPGRFTLVNQVQGINHREGVFRPETWTLGAIRVSEATVSDDHAAVFRRLRENADVIADIDRYREEFDRPVDRELVMTLRVSDLPKPIEQSMLYDWIYFNPVEWTGTMPMMNWATTGREIRWILRDPSTGAENEAIEWSFRVGDVVRVRVHNDRNAFHAMQHPLHIHGQRFLVLTQNGVPTVNLVWKDTVLLPAGSTTDILLEVSNPGRWMVHCHIAEHLESGMKLVMDVADP